RIDAADRSARNGRGRHGARRVARGLRAHRARRRHRRVRAPHDRAGHPGRPARPRRPLGVAAAISLSPGAARRARRDDERRALAQRAPRGGRPRAPLRSRAAHGPERRARDGRGRHGGPGRRVRGRAAATASLPAVSAPPSRIARQMGTTAQSEPLFALLALSIAIAYERRRYVTAAALRSVAVVARYEAWAIFATVGPIVPTERPGPALRRRRGVAGEPPPARRWLVVALPVLPILAWAVLRRPVDGRWFGFLGDTHEFASQAVADKASRGVVGFATDALYYPAFVAVRVLGPVAVLAPFGVARAWREQGARFVLILAAGLAFVSLTWVQRSSLGLDRHFVAVVPLYATFAAQGIAVIAERLAVGLEFVGRRAGRRARPFVARGIALVFALGTLAGLFVMLDVWMGLWRGAIERGWPERVALGAYLRTVPNDAPIFCDDATLEILSGLDRRRFDRHWIDDPATWTVIAGAARAHGAAYVATWRRKLVGHEAAGAIVFRAADARDDAAAANAGVAVMRVTPDSDRAAR